MADKIRIICLGGQDEFNKKMTLVEINDDIFVLECGEKTPDITRPGIDYVIANFSYLVERKDKVKAYIITHGFDANLGGLPYIYQKVPAPVYCSDVTKEVIMSFSEHNKINLNINFQVVKSTDEVIISGHRINFFATCSSMSHSSGVSINTSEGNIILLESFVIDNNADEDFLHDGKTLGKLSEETTLVLLTESRYSTNQGYSNPKYKLLPLVENAFKEAQGRIFVALGVPDLYNITKIMAYAIKKGRKLIPYDQESKEVYDRYAHLHASYKNIPTNAVLPIDEINRVSSKDIVVLVIGWGERLYHKISLLASGENKDKRFALNSTDTFIVALTHTNETEIASGEAINELYKANAKVVTFRKNEFIRMHASEEDLKTIIALLRPKFYIPVYGTLRELYANAKVALNMGIGLNFTNIFVIDNGDAFEYIDKKAKIAHNVALTGDILVDGKGIGDVSNDVINERQRFSDDGVIILAITLSNEKRKIIAGPDIQMRGFIYLKDSEQISKEITKTLNIVITQALNDKSTPLHESTIEQNINETIFRLVRRLSGKSPCIIPFVKVLK